MKTTIKIDKNLTKSWEMDKVKADAAEFRKLYNEKMMALEFIRQYNEISDKKLRCYNPDIIGTEIEAFPRGYAFGDETSFWVKMTLEDCDKIYKVTFFTDLALALHTDDTCNLITVKTFQQI